MQHRSVVVLAFLIFSLVTIGTLQAKQTGPVPKGKAPFIQEAQVDFDVAVECPDSGTIASDTLTITGIGLGLSGGPSPVITLGTYPPLTVCVFDDELVLAELPLGTEDGDYLLSVITSNGAGGFDLTIGAIGPQGADGNDGVQGPEGPAGAQGPEGPAGADGASCSVSVCAYPVAELTCGTTSVNVSCLPQCDQGEYWDINASACSRCNIYSTSSPDFLSCICNIGFYLPDTPDNYGVVNECLVCPEGADCSQPGTTWTSMGALEGYWR